LADYPAQAVHEKAEGTVGVAVTVDPEGKVSGCAVIRSSGHMLLDAAACEGMRRYARFNPALDHGGNPTNGSYATAIMFRLN
jgi:protein TonB